MAGNPQFKKQWNELAYIVDVKVQTVQGIPKVYTVINYYEEDTLTQQSKCPFMPTSLYTTM